jgi:hypothetical protein
MVGVFQANNHPGSKPNERYLTMTIIPTEQQVRSLVDKKDAIDRYIEKWFPSQEQHIYVYSIAIESISVDGDNCPLDTRVLTAYFKEHPFEFEIEEWANPWLDYGYKVVEKSLIEHQKLNPDTNIFETVWKPPVNLDFEF